jgi:hypothetical protein
MPNPLTLTDAADLIDLSIQDIWLKGSEKESKIYEGFYNTESGVTDYYTKDSSLTGLGYAGKVVENAAITSQSPVQGYDQTYTQVHYGVIMSFTKMMWMFGIKKRNLENVTTEARKACSDLRELRLHERLDNAFSASYSVNDISGNYLVMNTGGDGIRLISNAHTREDGGTNWNNTVYDGSTYSMDWEYDALKAAHRTASLIRNPMGKPMNINLDTLIVSRGQANHHRAVEILGAFRKGWMPATGDRDGQGVPDYKIIATPWILSNTGYWFMLDSSMKSPRYGLQYKEAQGINLEGPNLVFKTKEIQYSATMIFDYGFNDNRCMVGSANNNSTTGS